VILCFALASCAVKPNDIAMEIGKPPKAAEGKPTLNFRVMQTRRFETLNEKRLLSAATQTFQDLGYTVSESSLESGVLVGSKIRDAEEGGQVAGQVVLTILMAALGSAHNPVWDKSQEIVLTLTTSPVENSKLTDVRVSFDRRLTNNHGHLWRTELIINDKIYQEFFEKFSKSAFLEANKL
jgi:hypothetical protein